jgi:hypothetical protein
MNPVRSVPLRRTLIAMSNAAQREQRTPSGSYLRCRCVLLDDEVWGASGAVHWRTERHRLWILHAISMLSVEGTAV